MSVKHLTEMAAFPLIDVKRQRSTEGDVRTFGRFISFASAAHAVVIANRGQHGRVLIAVLENQAPYTWEQPDMRDFWN